MIEEIRRLLDDHQRWLRDSTVLREVGRWVEITTPFVDRHNDLVQIYASKDPGDGSIVLTDDGYTIGDLELSGCKLDTPKRQDLLRVTLNGFGVRRTGDALETRTSPERFPLSKHNLVQAMLAVGDLFYVAEPIVQSLFLEDVQLWLDEAEVRYTERVSFAGKSGYGHVFDFVIPRSQAQPERVLRAVNHPTKQTAEMVAFSWIDTKEVRPAGSLAFAILNDSSQAVSSDVGEALRAYDITAVRWSERASVIEQLAA